MSRRTASSSDAGARVRQPREDRDRARRAEPQELLRRRDGVLVVERGREEDAAVRLLVQRAERLGPGRSARSGTSVEDLGERREGALVRDEQDLALGPLEERLQRLEDPVQDRLARDRLAEHAERAEDDAPVRVVLVEMT